MKTIVAGLRRSGVALESPQEQHGGVAAAAAHLRRRFEAGTNGGPLGTTDAGGPEAAGLGIGMPLIAGSADGPVGPADPAGSPATGGA